MPVILHDWLGELERLSFKSIPQLPNTTTQRVAHSLETSFSTRKHLRFSGEEEEEEKENKTKRISIFRCELQMSSAETDSANSDLWKASMCETRSVNNRVDQRTWSVLHIVRLKWSSRRRRRSSRGRRTITGATAAEIKKILVMRISTISRDNNLWRYFGPATDGY